MTAALLGFAAIFVLALMRVPLAFAMGLVGFAGIAGKSFSQAANLPMGEP